MRVFVHDFGGYSFPLQLSRALASRGHTVRHVYCASLTTTPPGVVDEDNSDLEVHGITLRRPVQKYAYVRRWWQEVQYGRLVSTDCATFKPDVVLSGNTPLSAQRRLIRACRKRRIRFVFWVQDFLGIAARSILSRKNRLVGQVVGNYFTQLEGHLLRKSDAVVAIAEAFEPTLRKMHVDTNRITVIQNWACIEELPVRPKNNPWAAKHHLDRGSCFLYSGTLSMKHNPDMLLQLAIQMRTRPEVSIVVVSQGAGAEWLQDQKARMGLDRLIILPYQDKKYMADVYATADILVALLDEVAGSFSVPSKVSAYLCAKRPLLLAVPPDNLAARLVSDHGAGIVVAPTDMKGFLGAAETLFSNPELTKQMGAYARAYAEKAYAIDPIADRFMPILVESGNQNQNVQR